MIELILCLILIFLLILVYCRSRRCKDTLAFFHPYCNAGGGGERVLWRAIAAMQKRNSFKNIRIVIYTGDTDVTPDQIIKKASQRFNIVIEQPNRLKFVFLQSRNLLEPKKYPFFTLIGQSLGGLFVGIEAIYKVCPEYFIETTGCPFTLPLFRIIGGSRVACYIHYPTITDDMIELVNSRVPAYNNVQTIASSWLYSKMKAIYYIIFRLCYSLCGHSCEIVMVNGSWSAAHIEKLWKIKPIIVYPPCNVEELIQLENNAEKILEEEKIVNILSVGQIRPEKNHLEQLRVFAEVRKLNDSLGLKYTIRHLIAGGCRDDEDFKRVSFLQNYARGNFALESGRDIFWHINISFDELSILYKDSLIGLHTMWNEHFGISVVEGMAASNIMIANNSGGPKLDIIKGDERLKNKTCGYLCSSKEEYAEVIINILKMTFEERSEVRDSARKSVSRFSDSIFDQRFCLMIDLLVNKYV